MVSSSPLFLLLWQSYALSGALGKMLPSCQWRNILLGTYFAGILPLTTVAVVFFACFLGRRQTLGVIPGGSAGREPD